MGMSQSIPGGPIAHSPLPVYLLDSCHVSSPGVAFHFVLPFIRCMWVRHDNHQRIGAYVKFQRVASFIWLTYYDCFECFYE